MLTLELRREGSSCAASSDFSDPCCLFRKDRRDGIGINKWRFFGALTPSAADVLSTGAAEDKAGSEGATEVASWISVASVPRPCSDSTTEGTTLAIISGPFTYKQRKEQAHSLTG
jgi:hypothetical protein